MYECKCEECGDLYVGEIERPLGERTQEYDKSVKEGDSKLALNQHKVRTGYKVQTKPMIEGVSMKDNEPRNLHRNVMEAIHIKL